MIFFAIFLKISVSDCVPGAVRPCVQFFLPPRPTLSKSDKFYIKMGVLTPSKFVCEVCSAANYSKNQWPPCFLKKKPEKTPDLIRQTLVLPFSWSFEQASTDLALIPCRIWAKMHNESMKPKKTCMQKTCHGEEKDKKRQGFDLKSSDEEEKYQWIFIIELNGLLNTKILILIKGDRNPKR